jgi:predicted glutamine amidotransferase
MCGLVGMAGDFQQKHRKMMVEMLYLDTLRGEDSTGVSSLRSTRQVATRKLTVPGYDFVKMPWIDQQLGLTDYMWLGHNRFRTIGSATRLNAHPFEVIDGENLIVAVGAHNGTLKNKYELQKELGAEFGTDSEVLLNLIAKIGPKEAISKTEGAWSLVWWDAYEDSVFLLRNKERPMYFAYSDDRRVVFWASEAWIISASAARNDVKLEDNKVWMTTEDTLYQFKIPSRKNGVYAFAPHDRKGGFSGKEPTFFPAQGKDGGNKTSAQKGSTTSSTTTSHTCSDPTKLIGYKGRLVDRKYVETLKEDGCVWCDTPIDGSGFGWLDDTSIICNACLRDSHHECHPDDKGAPSAKDIILSPKQKQALVDHKKEKEKK